MPQVGCAVHLAQSVLRELKIKKRHRDHTDSIQRSLGQHNFQFHSDRKTNGRVIQFATTLADDRCAGHHRLKWSSCPWTSLHCSDTSSLTSLALDVRPSIVLLVLTANLWNARLQSKKYDIKSQGQCTKGSKATMRTISTSVTQKFLTR